MSKERKKSNSIPMMVSLLLIGMVVLVLTCSNSNLMVSETWVPTMNTRPSSLVCHFQSLEFSKEIKVSDITGEKFVLLTIRYSGLQNFTVYTDRSVDTIQEVGYLTWKTGQAYAIMSREISSGNYIIGIAEIDYLGIYETQGHRLFVIVEEIHEPNALEEMLIQYSYLAKILLIIVLTSAYSIILLPMAGLVGYFVRKKAPIQSKKSTKKGG